MRKGLLDKLLTGLFEISYGFKQFYREAYRCKAYLSNSGYIACEGPNSDVDGLASNGLSSVEGGVSPSLSTWPTTVP